MCAISCHKLETSATLPILVLTHLAASQALLGRHASIQHHPEQERVCSEGRIFLVVPCHPTPFSMDRE